MVGDYLTSAIGFKEFIDKNNAIVKLLYFTDKTFAPMLYRLIALKNCRLVNVFIILSY